MTIDYDRLRDAVENLDAPETALAADAQHYLDEYMEETARELLRLRGEIQATRDRVADELEHIPEELHCARITLYTERDHFLAFCNHLLEEDNE